MTTIPTLLRADTVTRADVRVTRTGWVTDTRYDSTIGLVTRDTNAAGQQIWRAQAGDIGTFSFTRAAAVAGVLELHNLQEKARAYDLLSRAVSA